ncbi:hypothetical protein EK904_013767 [Melospiza melodia maxima]|nr:hypothetical protein EK904_013767 [Melospiza melodia maxima]
MQQPKSFLAFDFGCSLLITKFSRNFQYLTAETPLFSSPKILKCLLFSNINIHLVSKQVMG